MKKILDIFRQLPLSLKKLVLVFAFLQFIYYFNFFWLIQNIYILDHGVSFTQLQIILAIWSASVIIFEIPSGILADKWGRKPIISVGKFAFLTAIAIFAFFPSFLGFAIMAVALGIHEAFISGAQEALLYDNLKDHQKEKFFGRIIAFAITCREIGLGLGALVAGVVTQTNVQWNLLGSTIIAFLGFITSLLLVESKSQSKSGEVLFLKHLKSSVKKARENHNLVRLIIFSATVITSYVIISEYFVVALERLGMSYVAIGILAAVEALFFAFGSYLSQKLSQSIRAIIYPLLSILIAIFMLMVSQGTAMFVIAGYLVLRTIKAMAEIISTEDWQKHVESEERATTISINSFLRNISYIIFGFLFGRMADRSGLFRAFCLTALLSASYLIFPRIPKRKIEQKST